MVIYEPQAWGHAETYLMRLVEAIGSRADVVVAAPRRLLVRLDPSLPTYEVPDHSGRFATLRRVDSFRRVVRSLNAGLGFYLSGDKALPLLAFMPRLHSKQAVLMLRPREPGVPEAGRPEWLSRLYFCAQEIAVAVWRARRDASVIFTLDERVANRWSKRSGSGRIAWLPEPPVQIAGDALSPTEPERSGVLLYGSLTPRKGVERLAAAMKVLSESSRGMTVTLAGAVDQAYAPELMRVVREMRSNGITVELQLERLSEEGCLRLLRSAEVCAVPYVNHRGMSRVLLEAAVCGTPVVAEDYGLIGHLVNSHGLGVAVDCSDPNALAAATVSARRETRRGDLEKFASRYSTDQFAAALNCMGIR
ncbi:MAG TPA: glycosyltransferase [Gaiellaceae bacterium]|nr:glycosyltransferase [Gaiellaceae bacterium]